MTNTSLSEGSIYCGVDSVCLGRYKISVRQSFPPAFNPIFSYMSLFLTPCPAKKNPKYPNHCGATLPWCAVNCLLKSHSSREQVSGPPQKLHRKESSTFANKYCIWENGFLQNQIRDFTLGAEENNNQWPHTNTRLRQKH